MTSRIGAKKKGSWGNWSEWKWDSIRDCWQRSMEHDDGRVRYQYGGKSNDPRFSPVDTVVNQYRSATPSQLSEVPVEDTTVTSNYTSGSHSETHIRPSNYAAGYSPAVLTAGQGSASLNPPSSTHYPVSQASGEELDFRPGQSNTNADLNALDEIAQPKYPYSVQGFQRDAAVSPLSPSYSASYTQNTTYGFDGQSVDSYENQPGPPIEYGSQGQQPNTYFPKTSRNVSYASGGQNPGLSSPQFTRGASYLSEGQNFSQYPQIGGQIFSSNTPQFLSREGYGSGSQQSYYAPELASSGSPYPAPSNANAIYGEFVHNANSYGTGEPQGREKSDSLGEEEASAPPAQLRLQRRSSNAVDEVAKAMVNMRTSETQGRKSESNRKRSPTGRSRGSSTKHRSSQKQGSQPDAKNRASTKSPQQLENAFTSPRPLSGHQRPSKKSSMEPSIPRTIKQSYPSRALHPDYMVHHSSQFKKGKVFKILWSEPSGAENEAANDTLDDETQIDTEGTYIPAKHGETAYHSIRRFVIVKTTPGHSLCLPIFSYGKKATTKPGVKHDDHAIIYTGEDVPTEVEGEQKLHKTAIRMEGKTAQHKLSPESRINYAKVYTVEHNTKVCFIGAIHPDNEHRFFSTWKQTMYENDE